MIALLNRSLLIPLNVDNLLFVETMQILLKCKTRQASDQQ